MERAMPWECTLKWRADFFIFPTAARARKGTANFLRDEAHEN
jgi:hypothetical protein